MNKAIKIIILVVATAAGFVNAALRPYEVQFTNFGGGNDWETAENWANNRIPGETNSVVFNTGSTGRLRTSATVLSIKPGYEGTGGLVVDGGILNVIGMGNDDWSVVGFSHDGALTVQNNGSVLITKWFSVGRYGTGILTIYEGTVRVEGEFRHYSLHHFPEEKLRDDLPSRTTLYPGGVLDVGGLVLNAGVVDVAGGTLMVRNASLPLIEKYIDEGRIIAMSGADGWDVQAAFDIRTGYIKVVAVSSEAPLSVGMRDPDPSGNFCRGFYHVCAAKN